MWFKNLHIFRFLQPFTLTAEELHDKLSQAAFHPCGRMDMSSMGWVAPLNLTHSPTTTEYLVHAANRCFMIAARKQEKILPASVIRDFVKEKVTEIETQQQRKVRKHEKNEIRETVLQDLIPRAFSRSTQLFAYIDVAQGWLLIDTANRKRAEELMSLLRNTLGSLPVVPPAVKQNVAQVMTEWLTQQRYPADFALADACQLVNKAQEEGATVSCKRQDLLAQEIHSHLDAGKWVTRLALQWNERLAFVLDEELTLRRIQWVDIEHTNDKVEDYAQQFDADFAIMVLEFAAFIQRLFTVFGGEDEAAYQRIR